MNSCSSKLIKSEPVEYINVDPTPSLFIKVEMNDGDKELMENKDWETKSINGTSAAEDGVLVLQCEKCGVPYSKSASYKNHVAVCKRDDFNKPLSKEELSRSENVRSEMRRSIKILERSCFSEFDEATLEKGRKKSKYGCPECDEVFPNVRWYARHVYAHTFVKKDVNDLPHICADCGKDFPTKHLAKLHLDKKKFANCQNLPKLVFPCDICQKMFTRKDNLREHLRAHAGMAETRKLYDCIFCKRSFGGASILNIHLRSHVKNSGSYSHACNICKKTFACASSLKKHVRMHEVRQFQCESCSSTFSTQSAARKHYQRHKTELDDVCEEKGTTFQKESVSHESINEEAHNFNSKRIVMRKAIKSKKKVVNKRAINSHPVNQKQTFQNIRLCRKEEIQEVKTYVRKRKIKEELSEIGEEIITDIYIKEEPVF